MVSSHLYEDSAAFSYREIETAVPEFPNQEAARYNMKQSEMGFIEIPLFNSEKGESLHWPQILCSRITY
jgi:hypothetical protein